ncbi:MAG: hypothetical protein FGM18_00960 [Burkholderiaceae bacterium]|nr:hypothetical protein [Burkholderiaceae bacterium]
MQTKSPSERAACLETVKQQLTAHHQEHRAILMQNIGTLGPNHPVMQSILGRLRERERFASMAIDNDHEPTYLATVRKESCLSQR